MIEALQRLLRPLHARLANLVSRAVVSRVDDSTKLQGLQVKVGVDEVRDGLERFQQYGLTSVPDAGAEAVVLFVGGRRDVGYVVAVDDRRYRLTGLAPGEVALYSKTGASVVLKADGSVEVNPAPGQVVKLAGEADAVAKGAALNSAVAALGTAIAGALTTMGAAPTAPMPGSLAVTAGSTVTTAVTAFNASAQAALSTSVKLS
jgi:phage baseplate assembly protein V